MSNLQMTILALIALGTLWALCDIFLKIIQDVLVAIAKWRYNDKLTTKELRKLDEINWIDDYADELFGESDDNSLTD